MDDPTLCGLNELSNTEPVIRALEELSGWLTGFAFQQEIDDIIDRLRRGPLSEWERKKIRQRLSGQVLFHPKCMGDIYVPDFVGDGTSYAWWNYLSGIAKICQNNL